MSIHDRRVVESYLNRIEDGRAIALIWTVNDVRAAAKEIGHELDEEFAREILQQILHMGINWDMVQLCIKANVVPLSTKDN